MCVDLCMYVCFAYQDSNPLKVASHMDQTCSWRLVLAQGHWLPGYRGLGFRGARAFRV